LAKLLTSTIQRPKRLIKQCRHKTGAHRRNTMRHFYLTTIAAASALMFATSVHAQPAPLPDYGPNITLEQAMKAGQAALADAKKKNLNEGIAVVDIAGRLVYFIKMDNSRAIAVELAQHKARTAAMFKLPSKAV
jgi:hypothetical protein